jgi:hypothetical protein
MRTVAPVDEQAVRPAMKHAVDPNGLGLAQGAAVVVPRGIEPRVHAGFDASMVAIRSEPARGRELATGRRVINSTVPRAFTSRWRCTRAARVTRGKPAAFFQVSPANGSGII